METGNLAKNVLYYGKDEPLAEQIELRAGPLALIYEAGDLRYIRLGEREILRRLYVAVRDRNWGTVPARFSNVRVEQHQDSFAISYDAEHRQGEIDFFWQGAIAGDARGTITFTMDGVARSTFLRNRIGFCVLHPIRECAGARCRVEHVGGEVEETSFPLHIAPQSIVDGAIQPVHPFAEMHAMAREIASGVWAEVLFDGEVFEMEDQRNWTDASYKTYGTPLRLPFPVQIQRGTRVAQSISLTLNGQRPTSGDDEVIHTAQPISFVVRRSSSVGPLPRIGLGIASHGRPLSERELARLKALNLAHLRVDLDLTRSDYIPILSQAASEARALGVTLEVALTLSDAAQAELDALAAALARIKPPVHAWLIFHAREKSTGEPWMWLARERLAGYDPRAALGSGTNVYFTELNRGQLPVQALDLVCYSINPQVHAFDNASLVETLQAQAATVASARELAGELPLAITPVTLLPRFNPNATAPDPEPAPGELPRQVDVRQMSLFGAGWTAGSLKYLCESGAASLTYYETSGWRGVMETEAGSPLPERFRSLPGAVFPLYHVLADVGEFAGGEALPAASSEPLYLDGLAMRKDQAMRALLANLGPARRRVRVQHGGRWARVRILDETNAEQAMLAPEAFRAQLGELLDAPDGQTELELLPFAIARIDVLR